AEPKRDMNRRRLTVGNGIELTPGRSRIVAGVSRANIIESRAVTQSGGVARQKPLDLDQGRGGVGSAHPRGRQGAGCSGVANGIGKARGSSRQKVGQRTVEAVASRHAVD